MLWLAKAISMKLAAAMLLCFALLAALGGCGSVSRVKVIPVESELYSQKDISAAIRKVERDFRWGWSGCTLTEIAYAGDERTAEEAESHADMWDYDELIVLISSFDVDSSGGDGSLNPNSTYDNWSWFLIRRSGGEWMHADHGY